MAKSKLLATWTANLDEEGLGVSGSGLITTAFSGSELLGTRVAADASHDGNDEMTSSSYSCSSWYDAAQELPRLYAAWGCRRWRRAVVSFSACHPFLGIFPVGGFGEPDGVALRVCGCTMLCTHLQAPGKRGKSGIQTTIARRRCTRVPRF